MTALVLAPDSEYVIRQAMRAQPDLAALVNGRVDLHEPRSPVAEWIVLDLLNDGEVDDDPFQAVEAVVQFGCWAPNKKRAKVVAATVAGWVQTLRGTRVTWGADAAVPGYDAGTPAAFALFATWQSTIPHPQSKQDNAGYIVTAAFRLSPV